MPDIRKTKRIPPASGSKAAQRDPVVEIDVSSKSLTDEGFFELARALIESILYDGEHGRVVRLEELCLRDAGLTPASLKHLSRIIQLACNDLRDLDLSNNDICINTPEEIAAWEWFLRSFSRCCVLRRVDLSGNNLGPKAFEILTRVYSGEQIIDMVLPEHLASSNYDGFSPSSAAPRDLSGLERKMSIVSESDDLASHDEEESGGTLGKHRAKRHGFKSPEQSGTSTVECERRPVYATTKGLRSVPYVVLSNTSMDETSALHLSYILAYHHTPARLLTRVPPAKAGLHAQQLVLYDSETRCRGIIYLPNSTLSNAANRVLELAEKVRNDTWNSSRSSKDDDGCVNELCTDGTSGLISKAAIHRRQSSTTTCEETHESIASDLDRARSRLQGNALESASHRSNDLWRTALKMLSISRNIQLQKAAPEPQRAKPQIIRTLEIPGVTPKKGNVWGNPLGPKSSNQTMSPRLNRARKDSVTLKPSSTMNSPNPTKVESHASSTLGKRYRSKLPCGFSEGVWWRILGYVAGANGLLSPGQQGSVLRYAMDRETLKKERDSLGLKDAAQIWHVLEGMDCLAYETR